MSARDGKRWNNERREWVVENLEEEAATLPADDEDILSAARERTRCNDGARLALCLAPAPLLTFRTQRALRPPPARAALAQRRRGITKRSACRTLPRRPRSSARITCSRVSWYV